MSSSLASSSDPRGATFQAIFEGVSQKLAFTGTSAQSSAFNANTSVIQIVATVACFVRTGANPTAVADTCQYIPPNVPMFIAVNGGDKIAAIQSAGAGNLFITEGLGQSNSN